MSQSDMENPANTVVESAPCKINLTLRVLGKREDGFHAIETVMAAVDVQDTLRLEQSEEAGVQFNCSDASLPVDGTNLVVRAAGLFIERTGIRQGVRIHLEKRIPHGAGLGGGSSDAAATLRGMNRLFATGIGHATLEQWCSEMGSDIPFFIRAGFAQCTGRGEIIEPWEGPAPCGWRLLLIKPPFAVPTPDIYKRWAASLELPGICYAAQEVDGITLVNDLERPAFEKFPVLGLIKQHLLNDESVRAAMLSGSGSTVFAVLHDGVVIDALEATLREEFGETLWIAAAGFVGEP